MLVVASGVRCSCETRECGSEKCAGRWVVSIQRCLWLCRGKVAVRRSHERAVLLSSRGARRVEDPRFVSFARQPLSTTGTKLTSRPRDPSSLLDSKYIYIYILGAPTCLPFFESFRNTFFHIDPNGQGGRGQGSYIRSRDIMEDIRRGRKLGLEFHLRVHNGGS